MRLRERDSVVSNPTPAPESSARLDEIADMMLTRAFLGAERVDSSNIKDEKRGITVRLEHVFKSRNTVYIHYAIRNSSAHPYRVPTPTVEQVLPLRPYISVPALRFQQLQQTAAAKLGKSKQTELEIAHAETQKEDLASGEQTQGVIAIRKNIDTPAVLEISFGTDSQGRVKATLVL